MFKNKAVDGSLNIAGKNIAVLWGQLKISQSESWINNTEMQDNLPIISTDWQVFLWT